MMGSILVSETLVLRTVSRFSQQLHRLFSAKKFLYAVRKEREKKEDKSESARKEEFVKETGFTTHLSFEENASKIKALKNFKGIMIDQVKIEWQDQMRHRTDTLVTFVFKTSKKAKKKE